MDIISIIVKALTSQNMNCSTFSVIHFYLHEMITFLQKPINRDKQMGNTNINTCKDKKGKKEKRKIHERCLLNQNWHITKIPPYHSLIIILTKIICLN